MDKAEPFGRVASVGDRLLRWFTKFGPRKPWRTSPLKSWAHELGQASLLQLASVAVLAALCGTGVLYLLNTESQYIADDDYSILTALGFVVLLIAYRLSQRHLISHASEAIESALHDWRRRIAEKTLRLSLRDIEHMSAGRLLDGIARHYAPLSQSIVTIVSGVESLILLVFMFGYLIYLSMVAAALTAAVAFLCVVAYMNVARQLARTMSETSRLNGKLDRLSESSIKGAKELRLNGNKRDALLDDMINTSDDLFQTRSASAGIFAEVISIGNTASYLMAGAVVFILPILNASENTEVSMIVMAVIFLIGPIGGVIGSIQQFSIARFAVNSILDFEKEVDQLRDNLEDERPQAPFVDFKEIQLEHVGYSHEAPMDSDQPFSILDVSLTIQRGQLIFITGGNGSGKTTLLRVLTGLYPRNDGQIQIDGASIPKAVGQDYRDLFATVFADFHVFGKTYGINDDELSVLEKWLTRLQIRSKLPQNLTKGFNPDALSTGQRKRLALALALAEDREVLILDEWAADQDPATRKRFYEEILPELKTTGKTVVVVTHDERYFDCSDLRVHMKDGRLHMPGASNLETSQ